MRADEFQRAFRAAFDASAAAAGFVRRANKWDAMLGGHSLQLAFRVNPKVAGLADTPGEFWPVLFWKGPGSGVRDDGTVSYYQYATPGDLVEMQSLRRGVVQKVIARAPPGKSFAVLLGGLDLPLVPQHPHVALYYFGADDAAAWGAWFAARINDWSARFQAAPETLDAYCRRVLWRKP